MLKQHCRSNWQLCCCCFDIVAKNGNNVEATFDYAAFDNVASTLLLVWTGFNVRVTVVTRGRRPLSNVC